MSTITSIHLERIDKANQGIQSAAIVLNQILMSEQVSDCEGKCDTVFNGYVRCGLIAAIEELAKHSACSVEFLQEKRE